MVRERSGDEVRGISGDEVRMRSGVSERKGRRGQG